MVSFAVVSFTDNGHSGDIVVALRKMACRLGEQNRGKSWRFPLSLPEILTLCISSMRYIYTVLWDLYSVHSALLHHPLLVPIQAWESEVSAGDQVVTG